MHITYNGQHYDKASMDALMVTYESRLKQLISYCLNYGKQESTPSDLTYKKLSLAGLNELQHKYDLEDVYPLSPLQEGMIFHYLLDESADHYFVQACYRVTGALNINVAERSLKAIVNRYDVLRTLFLHSGYERTLQVVLRSAAGAFTYKDIREEVGETGREAAVEKYRRSDRARKFRLSEGMLIRLGVYRTGKEDYEFIWSFHHILMDGWCLGILVSEFNDLYKGYLEEREVVLPAVRPYSDYIGWLEQRDKERSLGYWRDYLSGYKSLASIPVDSPRAGDQGFSLMTERLVLDRQQTGALRKIGGKYGVTLNTLLQSAWGILLARYNNVRDVVVGSVVSGRPSELPGVEQMVGLFINTIPVRISYEEEESLSDLVRRVQEKATDGEPYHYNSLPEIQSVAGVGALFDHILVFENYPIAERVEGVRSSEKGSYRVTHLKIVEQTNYDLTLIIRPGAEVSIEFFYNAGRYEPAGIRRLMGHLAQIIGQMEKGMDLPVGRLDMLTAEERDELVYTFNATATDRPEEKTIIDLFETQVRKTPGNVAVKFGHISITYRELKEKADRMANYLQQVEGVKVGDRVGLLLDREVELLPAVFGIVKSGAVYVPLSTNNPPARLRFILKDAGLKALITRRHHIDTLFIEMDAGLLDLDRSLEQINAREQTVLQDGPGGNDVAYIIYTSGSTGKPKGVMIEHASLLNLVRYMDRSYPLHAGDKYLLKTNIAFDVSLIEVFGWLSCGCSVSVLPPDSEKDPRMIIDHIAAESNTHVNFVPSMFSEFVKALEAHSIQKIRSVKYIMLAGEALPWEMVQRFQQLKTGVSLANIYGPTEGTIYSCGFSIPEDHRSLVIPIGKPIDNVRLYILDDSFRLVPKGVAGELYIAGAGVAKGYLNNEELNKDKFFTTPFLPGERIYRTGDRVKWLADGNVQYLGRKDHQVKIRGYRIELGEIERQLAGFEGITDAAVVLHEKGGNRYLAGYYMSERDIPHGELQSYLSQYLPDYMLPGNYQRMNAFPLTTSGKVDRNLFPHPDLTDQQAYIAPAGRTERILSKLWSEILKIDEQVIGVNTSFFELGGHSIRAIQLANKIQDVLSVQIGLSKLFGMNTIAEQAVFIENSRPDRKNGIPKAGQKPYYSASPAQERMYYHYLLDMTDTGRNISVAIELSETVNIQQLKAAFQQLVDRHSGLRTSFELANGSVVQKINPTIVFEWKSLACGEDESLKDRFRNFIQPFDLSNAPLIRAALVRDAGAGYLFIDIHHIVCDGSSMNVLVRDLRDLYLGKTLPAPELEYVDFAEWVRAGIENEAIHRNYWANKLSGNLRRMNLPVLQDRELVQKGAVCQLGLLVEKDLYKRVKLFLREADVSDFMFLLSICYIMLNKITGDQDIVIGTDGIGRNSKLPETMVGTFVNILPLRMEIEGESNYSRFLYGVKECVLEAIEHQEYPYDRIVALLKADDRRVVDVHFSFDNTFDSSAELEVLQFRSVDLGRDARNSEYDISIEVREKQENFQILFLYNRVLYDEETIRIFVDIYRKILDAVIDNEKTLIDKIAVSTAMII
jgi:amino acid adenylation domain-containing protein